MKRLTILLLFLSVIISGCSNWVKLTDLGGEVMVVTESDTSHCKEIGVVTVSLLAKVAGINRNAEKVQQELNTLARNSAGKLGGDTIAPSTGVVNGEQTYNIYRCH